MSNRVVMPSQFLAPTQMSATINSGYVGGSIKSSTNISNVSSSAGMYGTDNVAIQPIWDGTYSSGSITVLAGAVAGDTVVLDGQTLTATVGTQSGTQYVIGATPALTAASLAQTINANSTLSPLVLAVAVGATVTVTALVIGTAANAYGFTFTGTGHYVLSTTVLTMTSNASNNDTYTINGIVFKALTSGGSNATQSYTIGGTSTLSCAALATCINANPQCGVTALASSNTITLTVIPASVTLPASIVAKVYAGQPSYNSTVTATASGAVTFSIAANTMLGGGVPVGTFALQTALDFNPAIPSSGTWVNIPNLTLTNPAGTGGSFVMNLTFLAFPYIRLQYVPTSGTGTLLAYQSQKGIS